MKPQQQAAFDKFWRDHWPECRRKNKKQAADQWARIAPGQYPAIIAALERQKKQPAWNTGDCKFIPYAFRWLRDRRWEDEISLPEDKDADLLVEALTSHASAPPDFPKRIMNRFRKMCSLRRTNWPALHCQLWKDDSVGGKIKRDYLDAETP